MLLVVLLILDVLLVLVVLLVLSSHCGANILPRLIGLGPNDVLRPLLHLVEVLAPSVKLLQACQVDRVDEEAVLDLEVERRVASQRWRQVDLQEPRLEI